MRLMVSFDCANKTKTEIKEAGRFRKTLIKDGFQMIQYSVYIKTTRNYDDCERVIARVKKLVPNKGKVFFLKLTEQQYASLGVGENIIDLGDSELIVI